MKEHPTILPSPPPADASWWQPGPQRRPILSLFPGIDLLGRAFESEGFLVVRGPDILWGQDVRAFRLAGHAAQFQGIIGGPPCQQFSAANRARKPEEGMEMIDQFARLVSEGQPDWFLMENVNGSPDIQIAGYHVQRLNLNARECGGQQHRPRKFHFGWRDGLGPISPERVTPPGRESAAPSRCAMASEGKRSHRRTWAEFCALQGLPPDFDLPGWSLAAKYRAVGNGVPLPMATALTMAIKARPVTARLCLCECGRKLTRPGQTLATAACRKRMQRRRRDAAGKEQPRQVTPHLV